MCSLVAMGRVRHLHRLGRRCRFGRKVLARLVLRSYEVDMDCFYWVDQNAFKVQSPGITRRINSLGLEFSKHIPPVYYQFLGWTNTRVRKCRSPSPPERTQTVAFSANDLGFGQRLRPPVRKSILEWLRFAPDSISRRRRNQRYPSNINFT